MSGEPGVIHIVGYKKMSISTKDKQRVQILQSARQLVLADPRSKLRANEVAKRANIARTSLYEHFASMNDLMGELLLNELMDFRVELRAKLSDTTDLAQTATKWVNLNLDYFTEGRHALVRALMPAAMNSDLKDEIRAQHIMLYEELRISVALCGYELSPIRFELITAVLEAAAKRIEIGSSSPELVRDEALSFIVKALA
jgi:AcrR family transcriptional regulator